MPARADCSRAGFCRPFLRGVAAGNGFAGLSEGETRLTAGDAVDLLVTDRDDALAGTSVAKFRRGTTRRRCRKSAALVPAYFPSFRLSSPALESKIRRRFATRGAASWSFARRSARFAWQ